MEIPLATLSTHTDLMAWMKALWGEAKKDTIRGYHIGNVQSAWHNEFMELYYNLISSHKVTNNEVPTMLARSFATFKHDIDVDWESFEDHRKNRAHKCKDHDDGDDVDVKLLMPNLSCLQKK